MTDVDRASMCMRRYRALGLCPLPSRRDRKGPSLASFADHYNGVPVPEHVYRDWEATNIQLICGTGTPTDTRIAVVDCDSEMSCKRWAQICNFHGYVPRQSWGARTGGGGSHHYFLLPPDLGSCPSGLLWGLWDTWGSLGRGEWAKHQEIRLLADKSLVVAPPSIHVDTGRRYEYFPGCDPNSVLLPEPIPQWLLDMPRLETPSFSKAAKPEVREPRTYVPGGKSYERDQVIAGLSADLKLSLARQWRLHITGGPNSQGWVPCFVPGREDPDRSRPSGSFNSISGVFQDRKDMTSMSFFDLAVTLGAYQTWEDCCNDLGRQYVGYAG